MRQQFAVLHKMLLDTVRDDPVCRRLMTAPGVGAVVALTYRATVDQPQRFVHSRAVGAHVGLTPKRYQSGEIDYDGGVSKCGDALLRTMLYEAAHSLLTHGRQWSWLKAWGHPGGSAARGTSSHRRGRQASGRGSSPDVGEW
jgi:transposase